MGLGEDFVAVQIDWEKKKTQQRGTMSWYVSSIYFPSILILWLEIVNWFIISDLQVVIISRKLFAKFPPFPWNHKEKVEVCWMTIFQKLYMCILVDIYGW